jgi:hypothetical protein
LKINKVSDILRNVKEIKDRLVIIPKHITEKQKVGIMVVKRAVLFYLDPGCYALAFPRLLLW